MRALLSADTDQALVRARSSGEVLVGAMRLGLIMTIVVTNTIFDPSVVTHPLGVTLTFAAPLYALAMLFLAYRVQGSWISWASCAVDVTLITLTLSLFVVNGKPMGAINNRFLFETYAFVAINSTLRFDWRLCAFTSALAVLQYVGLSYYVAAHWDLLSLTSEEFGNFAPRSHVFRIIVLIGVGATTVAAAKWARHLRLMVGTDHLTGLSQRRPFLERIEEELARSGERSTLSIALFDVDEFKRFNDRFGHLAGDRALQLLAQRLRKLVRTTDLVARFGGEEFVVAFPRMDVARAARRVNELRADLAQVSLPTTEGVQHLTVSAGVGSWPEDGQTFDEVLGRVDERLYEAKRTGRNRIVGPEAALRSVQDA
ncbi:MAG: GGDEF domain-containing protein [Myxococcaceae bacterium]|nr:MAG: GGDEF domain-containing protein [Myxococcaceae bacterium]